MKEAAVANEPVLDKVDRLQREGLRLREAHGGCCHAIKRTKAELPIVIRRPDKSPVQLLIK